MLINDKAFSFLARLGGSSSPVTLNRGHRGPKPRGRRRSPCSLRRTVDTPSAWAIMAVNRFRAGMQQTSAVNTVSYGLRRGGKSRVNCIGKCSSTSRRALYSSCNEFSSISVLI